MESPQGRVAQLDRASGFEPAGRGFESLHARHFFQQLTRKSSCLASPVSAQCQQRATLRLVRSLAAAVLAHALTDLLRGSHTDDVLSWIDGSPAAPAVLDGVSMARYQPAGDPSAAAGDGCQPCCIPGAIEVSVTPYEDVLTPDLLAACAVAFRLAWVHSSP